MLISVETILQAGGWRKFKKSCEQLENKSFVIACGDDFKKCGITLNTIAIWLNTDIQASNVDLSFPENFSQHDCENIRKLFFKQNDFVVVAEEKPQQKIMHAEDVKIKKEKHRKKRKQKTDDDSNYVEGSEELHKSHWKRRAATSKSPVSNSSTETQEATPVEVKEESEQVVVQLQPAFIVEQTPEEINAYLIQRRDDLRAQVSELVKNNRAQLNLLMIFADDQQVYEFIVKTLTKLDWSETGNRFAFRWDLNTENELLRNDVNILQGKLLLLQLIQNEILELRERFNQPNNNGQYAGNVLLSSQADVAAQQNLEVQQQIERLQQYMPIDAEDLPSLFGFDLN